MLPRHTLLRKSSYGEGERIKDMDRTCTQTQPGSEPTLPSHSETDWVRVRMTKLFGPWLRSAESSTK